MYRVTTPTHNFNLPFDANTMQKFVLTYKQGNRTIVEKTENDSGVERSGKKLIVTLTQEETSMFCNAARTSVQLRAKIGDKVLASNIIEITVSDVLNNEVM